MLLTAAFKAEEKLALVAITAETPASHPARVALSATIQLMAAINAELIDIENR